MGKAAMYKPLFLVQTRTGEHDFGKPGGALLPVDDPDRGVAGPLPSQQEGHEQQGEAYRSATRSVSEAIGRHQQHRDDENDIEQYGRALLPVDHPDRGAAGPDALCQLRREVLLATLRQLPNAQERQRLRGKAYRNVARWRETAAAAALQELVVEIRAGDWGEVTKDVTMKYGELCFVLNMANAESPGGAYVEGYAAQEENMFRRTDAHFSITGRCYDRATDLYLRDHMDLLNARNGRVFVNTAEARVCLRRAENLQAPDLGYEFYTEDNVFPFYEMRAAAVDHRDGRLVDSHELRRRIRAQLDTLAEVGARLIVLGAWGCGAFLAPPTLVAQLYLEEIRRKLNEDPELSFKVIVFAIYHAGYGSDNFAPFQAAFESFQRQTPQSGRQATSQPSSPAASRPPQPAPSSAISEQHATSIAPATMRFVWQYYDPPSSRWNSYPEEVSANLEQRYLDVQHGDSADCRVSVTSAHFVDLGVYWKQFNVRNESKLRAVQRIPSSDDARF